jgi:hypothetical protein
MATMIAFTAHGTVEDVHPLNKSDLSKIESVAFWICTQENDHDTPKRGYCNECRDMAARIVWFMDGKPL